MALASLIAAAALASVSPADTQATARMLQSLAPHAVQSTTDLASPVLPVRDALAGAVRLPAGVARTSVDHSFAPGRLTGSAGFVCGLQDSLDHDGARDVTSHDPHGRFLGAKLSFAFR